MLSFVGFRRADVLLVMFSSSAVFFLVTGTVAVAEQQEDPPHYVKKATWEETMLASREALMRQEAAERAKQEDAVAGSKFRRLTVSMGGDQRSREIRISVAELDRLYIATSGNANKGWDCYFTNPKLIDGEGKVTKLRMGRPPILGVSTFGRIRNISAKRMKPPKKGSNRKAPTKEPTKEPPYGWMVQNGEVAVKLDGKYQSFEVSLDLPRGTCRVMFDTHPVLRHQDAAKEARNKLWILLERDFGEAAAKKGFAIGDPDGIWATDWTAGSVKTLANRYARASLGDLQGEAKTLAKNAESVADLLAVAGLYKRSQRFRVALQRLEQVNTAALRLAVKDLATTYGDRYPHSEQYLVAIDRFEKNRERLRAQLEASTENALAETEKFLGTFREAMLANPLLDFDRMLVVRRTFGASAHKVMSASLGLPSLNSRTHDTIPHYGWDNDIAVLSDLRSVGRLTPLYKPKENKILCEVDLNFDGKRIMFSSIGTNDRWQIFETDADGKNLKQLTPTDLPDVDFFDSCYLPCGDIAVTSTASYQGLPCEGGKRPMANLYRLNPATKKIRQLTFEQDSDWSPVVLNNGRLMYLRWEYVDAPHYFSRILFHCNPDGTNQTEYYGSNSYFPNAFFFARPIPEHSTQVVGIASGHHGISRSGRLLILDPAKGRHEADGVVQEIPGRGKEVEPLILDRLVDGVWPQFLNPYPLSKKYFLTAMKRDTGGLWGIYLVDVFDNMTLLKEVSGAALLEPVPLRPTKMPPVVPDRVVPGCKDSLVYLNDIYFGPGLQDIPRGKVKRLRLFSYHYAYNGSGGHASVGVESSWDVKRILGTVPVAEDGSALFRIPANTPISVQPLDEQGQALQLMRSWMVGMPGEVVSCVGCHENQNDVVPNRRTYSATRRPSAIEPWYGAPRPFGFYHEVQPVLDKYCVGCHDGQPREDKKKIPSFVSDGDQPSYKSAKAYMALQPYVRRPGPESDFHLTKPMEYHASTSELVQMLKKGHHNVTLDREAWERLVTWIDLNAPYRGKWASGEWRGQDQIKRRAELANRYANVDACPESEYDKVAAEVAKRPPIKPIMPEPMPKSDQKVPKVAGWPFDAAEAARRQAKTGGQNRRTIKLDGGQTIELVLIPAGEFVMGNAAGTPDEQPVAKVTIDRPFWMATTEINNAIFKQFDSEHDSRYMDMSGKDHNHRGTPANRDDQPVIRVTWQQAMAFCEWLSKRTGQRFSLPTEAEWEWACRGGSDQAFWFGPLGADFGEFANLADSSKGGKKVNPFLRMPKINDGSLYAESNAGYRANPWGLKNMHGNVAEWTRTTLRSYPYDPGDGRDDPTTAGQKVVRGGSWRDRPHRATSSFRLSYEPYQPVFNVGFRVVCEQQ